MKERRAKGIEREKILKKMLKDQKQFEQSLREWSESIG